MPPSEIQQHQDSSHGGLTWASSNAEIAQRLSKTFGKFNEKTSERVFAGCVYMKGTADELASREAMLDRLCADESVMPDQISADALKDWASSTMQVCKQLKCAIGDPGAGLRGATSCGAAVMTYPRACNRGICSDPEQLLTAPTASNYFQSQHATIERRSKGTNTLSLTIAIGLALDALLAGRDPAWIGVLAPSSPSFPFLVTFLFLTPHPVFAVDGQFCTI